MNILCTPRRVPAACACLLLGAGSVQAEGFVDGAKAGLTLRNFYINRNFVDPAFGQGKAEEWTQSFILDARSGFTSTACRSWPGFETYRIPPLSLVSST